MTTDQTPTVEDALAEALRELTAIIEKAGLLNLSNGVQLGQTSWYVKASDRMREAQEALARYDALEGAETREPDGWMAEEDAAALRNDEAPTVHVWRTPSPLSLTPVYIGAAPEPVERGPEPHKFTAPNLAYCAVCGYDWQHPIHALRCKFLKPGETCQLHNAHCQAPDCMEPIPPEPQEGS